jgi:hypothetical protein
MSNSVLYTYTYLPIDFAPCAVLADVPEMLFYSNQALEAILEAGQDLKQELVNSWLTCTFT